MTTSWGSTRPRCSTWLRALPSMTLRVELESSAFEEDLGNFSGWKAEHDSTMPIIPWAASKAAFPTGCGRWSCPSGETPPGVVGPQLWGSQQRKDTHLLKQVQRRPPRWSEGWRPCPVRKGWESGNPSAGEKLEKKPGWGSLATLVGFQYWKGDYQKAGKRLLIRARNDWTRGNGFKVTRVE